MPSRRRSSCRRFPDLARVFYLHGGCRNLALALNAATGLTIELGYRDGVPRHAYVVDETQGVDVSGRSRFGSRVPASTR